MPFHEGTDCFMAGILKMASGPLKSLFNWLVPDIKHYKANKQGQLLTEAHMESPPVELLCCILCCFVMCCAFVLARVLNNVI